MKEGNAQSHGSSNIFIAARTTELARLKLLEAMERIESFKKDGAKMLYCDTDSVIFRYPKHKKKEMFEALQVDDFFGCLKDEKKGYRILELYVFGF